MWKVCSLLVALVVMVPVLAQEKPAPVPKDSPAAQQLRANLELDACLAHPVLQKKIADLERTIRQMQLSQQCAAVEKDARDRLKPAPDALFNCYTQTFETKAVEASTSKGSP